MNEQIQKLAQAAEQLADDELAHLERVHNRLYSFTEDREILMGKFAELIVRECIKEIGYKSTELLDIDFYQHYQERLKKYFGVEE
jgi:AraC-like DNA-binding protein